MNINKAIAGAVAGFVTPFVAALTDVSPGGAAVTASEWVTALAGAVVGFAGVYVAPRNKDKRQL